MAQIQECKALLRCTKITFQWRVEKKHAQVGHFAVKKKRRTFSFLEKDNCTKGSVDARKTLG